MVHLFNSEAFLFRENTKKASDLLATPRCPGFRTLRLSVLITFSAAEVVAAASKNICLTVYIYGLLEGNKLSQIMYYSYPGQPVLHVFLALCHWYESSLSPLQLVLFPISYSCRTSSKMPARLQNSFVCSVLFHGMVYINLRNPQKSLLCLWPGRWFIRNVNTGNVCWIRRKLQEG